MGQEFIVFVHIPNAQNLTNSIYGNRAKLLPVLVWGP